MGRQREIGLAAPTHMTLEFRRCLMQCIYAGGAQSALSPEIPAYLYPRPFIKFARALADVNRSN
jgi:hypothetical protein